MSSYDYPIIVIGAGPGGLTTAIGAAKAKKRTLLIEKGTWGGDCANFGCVPSKALIASGHVARAIRSAAQYGVQLRNADFTGHAALERVRRIIRHAVGTHEPQVLNPLGVDTLLGTAEFQDPHTLLVRRADGEIQHVTGKQIVIASGSYAVLPPIEGLEQVPYLTNETVFHLVAVPKHLLVMGGGPIGCELAQAFHALGAEVTLIQRNERLLVKEEPEAQDLMVQVFRRQGVNVKLQSEAVRVTREGADLVLQVRNKSSKAVENLRGSHLLIATGRRPNLATLNLDLAGVAHTDRGITVDRYGRTTQRHVYAIGDSVGGQLFTHLAENHARTVVQSLVRCCKKPLDTKQAIPRCTYTSPEVGSAGMLEREAIALHGPDRVAVHTLPLSAVERAVTDDLTEGFIKIITKKRSKEILGFTLVAPHAGEMLGELALAMVHQIPLHKLRPIMHPFPTYSLGIRQTADL